MKNYLITQIKTYKKILVPLILFELLRGIFIIFIAWLFQCVIINGQWILILFIALACRIIIENFRMKKFNLLSLNFQENLRRKLHRSFFSSSTPIDSGEILTLIFNVVESFDEFFIKVLPNFLTIIILLPLILIVTSIIDPPSAMIFFVTLPIAPFLLYLIGQSVSAKNQVAMIALSKLNGDFRELISAITTLKIFKQIDSALTKLKSTSEQSAATTLNVLKIAFISAFALELITTLSIAIIAVTIGLRLVDDKISFDVALFLLILAPEFYSPIRQLGAAFHALIKAKDALIGLRSKVEGLRKNSSAFSPKPSALIDLVNVSFTYPNKKFPAIENVNLNFKAGIVTVITGESGCGKSTLLKILAGINQPTNGKIIFADQNIAYVPQQPHLFKTSIRNNLTIFQSVDDAKLKKILSEVDLNLNLDDQINSLSRGQLQRLGLARALLKNFSILIFDEPTASLDIETEKKILQVIDRYKNDRTIIIASHRPAVINFADEILIFS